MLPATHGVPFSLRDNGGVRILQMHSDDGMNRLTRSRVTALIDALEKMTTEPKPLIITGNREFFSVGADLREITALTSPAAHEFSQFGQRLMNLIVDFPQLVCAAICGYCMGGGLDLALACHYRIASRGAIFGHRGATLGLITGWGGTQRLSRLVGKSAALHMFVAAEKVDAQRALQARLVDRVEMDPLRAALQLARSRNTPARRRNLKKEAAQ
jgi:enoyl-CoA hydratase/carnithine racemase